MMAEDEAREETVSSKINELAKTGSLLEEFSLDDCRFFQSSPGGSTVLHIAAELGHEAIIGKALELSHQLLFERDTKGNTPFHLAAQSGQLSIISLFCRHGGGYMGTEPSSDGAPPPSAARHGEIEAHGDDHLTLWSRCLTDVKANGDQALHMALKKERGDVALFMLKSAPRLASFVNKVGESPLYLAVEGFCNEVVEKILDFDDGESYSVSGSSGQNPIHAAVKCRNWLALQLLMENRMDLITHTDEYGKNALHYAVEDGQNDTVKMFTMKSPFMTCNYDHDGFTPLLKAAELGSLDMVKSILKHCPYSLEFRHRNSGKTALHLARMDAVSIAVSLRSTNMRTLINERDNDGYTPLQLAVIESDYVKVIALAVCFDLNWTVRIPKDGQMMRPVEYLEDQASEVVSSLEQKLLLVNLAFLTAPSLHFLSLSLETLQCPFSPHRFLFRLGSTITVPQLYTTNSHHIHSLHSEIRITRRNQIFLVRSKPVYI